jgi:hypothetical protein
MLPEFAHSLYQRFEREGIPLLLAGGWAVCHHGYSRFTRDVDWICSRAHEARAIALMESLGFGITFQAMATRFQLKRDPAYPPVDLLWVSPESFAKMEMTDERAGVHRDMLVIDLPTLLAMKLNALKDREVRQDKDLLDIRYLLKENPGVVSDDELRRLCEKFAGPDAYNLVRMIP